MGGTREVQSAQPNLNLEITRWLLENQGDPPPLSPEFVEQARKVYQLGATDREVADVLDVAESTIYRWAKEHPEFAQAMKVGKETADDRVERSLYHKAVGYTYPSEKVFQFQGAVVRTPVTVHVPPDTTACIFWLKNRRKDDWRESPAARAVRQGRRPDRDLHRHGRGTSESARGVPGADQAEGGKLI